MNLMKNTDEIDNCIQEEVRNCLNVEQLCSFLKKALKISKDRKNRGKVAYGFEWLIHTSLASYLIDKGYEVHVGESGEKDNKGKNKKVDLVFTKKNDKILMEIKTIEEKQFCWINNDVEKLKNISDPSKKKYMLVVGYPYWDPVNKTYKNSVDEFNDEKKRIEEKNNDVEKLKNISDPSKKKLIDYFPIFCGNDKSRYKFRFYLFKV